jgi:predicted HAD superfamily Cof-like phosphohydrolase
MIDVEMMVRDFYWKYKCRHRETPGFLPEDQLALRKEILVEEFAELLEAIEERNLRHIIKEICDLVYVAVGFAVACGLPFNESFLAVHRSNLSKDGSRRADGKITKGATYVPPDLSFIEEES